MSDVDERPHAPTGDATRHLERAALDAALAALSPSGKDEGVLRLVVKRNEDGSRETPQRTRITPDEGVPGDTWNRRLPLDPQAQLTLMNEDVATLIANGQPLTHFGDNLIATLDLSASNLPTGTRIALGEAVIEVSPKPHNGCLKFKQRFGHDALRFVADPVTRAENRRGIYVTVIEAGEIGPGDAVRVLSRPASGTES